MAEEEEQRQSSAAGTIVVAEPSLGDVALAHATVHDTLYGPRRTAQLRLGCAGSALLSKIVSVYLVRKGVTQQWFGPGQGTGREQLIKGHHLNGEDVGRRHGQIVEDCSARLATAILIR